MAEDPTPATSEKGSAVAIADATQPLRAALRGITSIVAPTSVVTSLLFYFGWVRTSVQAADMGLDDSLLGYSTRDYILRSIDAMFWPLVVAVMTALGAIAVHVWLTGWAGDGSGPGHRRFLRPFTWAAAIAAVLCMASGIVGARRTDPSRLVFLASPLVLTTGIVVAAYSAHVRKRFLRPRAAVDRPVGELGQLQLVASSLAVVLLFLSVFFTVDRYAHVKGRELAVRFISGLRYQPDVTVYSARRLHLQAPVTETDLGDDGSAYRFSYSGLKLLFRADHSYFLRPSDESEPLNIVIRETDWLRLEFVGGLA